MALVNAKSWHCGALASRASAPMAAKATGHRWRHAAHCGCMRGIAYKTEISGDAAQNVAALRFAAFAYLATRARGVIITCAAPRQALRGITPYVNAAARWLPLRAVWICGRGRRQTRGATRGRVLWLFSDYFSSFMISCGIFPVF